MSLITPQATWSTGCLPTNHT